MSIRKIFEEFESNKSVKLIIGYKDCSERKFEITSKEELDMRLGNDYIEYILLDGCKEEIYK